jgi:hypothetical protein
MKKILTLLAITSICTAFGQSLEVIYTPAAGANDGTDEGGINGGKETWVNRFAPNDNYGNLEVTSGSPRSTCNNSDYKSYYQFDLSTLPAVVDSVFFGVHHYDHNTYCYSNCDADFYFYYVTSSWNEMELIHSNEPTEDATPFYGPINITFPNDFQNKEYNITTAYNQWKTGGLTNYGFAIYSPTVGCNNASVFFNIHTSDDPDPLLHPYLKVYYPNPAGLNEIALNITAYPNPFKDHFKIDIKGLSSYKLTDLSGRPHEIDYHQETNEFTISNLSNGLYLLHISTSNNEYKTIRLLKE